MRKSILTDELRMWIEENDIRDTYVSYCHMLQDSSDHVNFMINSESCFEEWAIGAYEREQQNQAHLDALKAERDFYDDLEAAKDNNADNRRESEKLGE